MPEHVKPEPSTLVCLIGNLRGGPEVWSTLIRHVLEPLPADLGILGEQTHREQTVLYAAARFVWHNIPEHHDWGEALDAFSGPPHEWRTFAALNNRSGLWGPAKLANRTLGGSGAIIFVLRMYLLERLATVKHKYAQIMVTRSDHYYLCDHPSLPVGSVWVPRGEDYPPFPSLRNQFKSSFSWQHCISERHVVFPSDLAVRVLAVLPWLLHARTLHTAVDVSDGFWPNPECAIGSFWHAHGIRQRVRRYPRPMFTAHRPRVDNTSWGRRGVAACAHVNKRVLRSAHSTSLQPKYCSEHAMAERGCRKFASARKDGVGQMLRDPLPSGSGATAFARSRACANAAPRPRPRNTCDGVSQRIAIDRVYGQSAGNASGCALRFHAPVFDDQVGSFTPPSWRCAVVSSSGTLAGSSCGGEIDAHDVVVRMNNAPTFGYEQDVGNVSSLRMMNSHNARLLAHGRDSINGVLNSDEPARAAWHRERACAEMTSFVFFGDEWITTGPAIDNETRVVQLLNHMQRCHVAKQFGRKAFKLSPGLGKWRGSIDRAWEEWYSSSVTSHRGGRRGQHDARSHKAAAKITSTGFVAVHTALALCREVTLYGFAAASPCRSPASFHYYGNETAKATRKTRRYHSMGIEHEYYQRRLGGRVRVCIG